MNWIKANKQEEKMNWSEGKNKLNQGCQAKGGNELIRKRRQIDYEEKRRDKLN
jgi:hypothetical protein